jgi:hypothetical protein
MDQNERNETDFHTCRDGMESLWQVRLEIKIEGIGLGYLRTTNLLTPGDETMHINQAIGLRAPKGFNLIGDVLQN